MPPTQKPVAPTAPEEDLVPDKPTEPTPAERAPTTPAPVAQTPEELDRLMAAAKGPEDYRAVSKGALRAAIQAADNKEKDKFAQLIRLALNAARKSGDADLQRIATRGLIKPDALKELFAEKKDGEDEDAHKDADSGDTNRPQPVNPGLGNGAASAGGNVPPLAVQGNATTKVLSLSGADNRGSDLGTVRRGTLITLQYKGGMWRNRTAKGNFAVSPDAAGTVLLYRVAIMTGDSPSRMVQLIPTGTSNHAFQWRADRDYPKLLIRSGFADTGARLLNSVQYQLTMQPPAN